MEGYVLQFWLDPPSENKGKQRERLLLTRVECVALIDIWVDVDYWGFLGGDPREWLALGRGICTAGWRTQKPEAKKQPQWQKRGPQDRHSFNLLANCWAWNWVKATAHLFICSGGGSSGQCHTCKCPAHSSLALLEFGPRYHQERISPSFCDPLLVPVSLKKGNVPIMIYFASHSPQPLICEGSYGKELIPAKWDSELSNHNLPGPCRNYILLCVGNSGIKALSFFNRILHTVSNTP